MIAHRVRGLEGSIKPATLLADFAGFALGLGKLPRIKFSPPSRPFSQFYQWLDLRMTFPAGTIDDRANWRALLFLMTMKWPRVTCVLVTAFRTYAASRTIMHPNTTFFLPSFRSFYTFRVKHCTVPVWLEFIPTAWQDATGEKCLFAGLFSRERGELLIDTNLQYVSSWQLCWREFAS